MTYALRPGTGLARRDAAHLQLGSDPPLVAVVPDTPAVRLLLVELAHGGPLTTLDDETTTVLDALLTAGLVVAGDPDAERRDLLARAALHLDVPDAVLALLVRLLGQAGLRIAQDPAEATLALVWTLGETPRAGLDDWLRSGTPHLLVRELADGVLLGPYVLPRSTACLRCVDAHLGERDPRRALVVEQLATNAPLRPAESDPVQQALAAAWAVHDLVAAASGDRPVSWSATTSLGVLPPDLTSYLRHPHCGCSWGDGLRDDWRPTG